MGGEAAKIMNELINSYNQQLTTDVCTLKNYIKRHQLSISIALSFFFVLKNPPKIFAQFWLLKQPNLVDFFLILFLGRRFFFMILFWPRKEFENFWQKVEKIFYNFSQGKIHKRIFLSSTSQKVFIMIFIHFLHFLLRIYQKNWNNIFTHI